MTMGSLLAASRFASVPACVRQELEQEARLRTLAATGIERPEAFARRVARNLAIDWLRRRRTVPLEEERMEGARCVEERLDVLRLRAVLRSAPEGHRQVLVRLYLQEEAIEVLVAELAGGSREAVGERAWAKARDAVYKRRLRALGWVRERM
jgi:DNA-directed RNA polymerase specialized sigma24 family protein